MSKVSTNRFDGVTVKPNQLFNDNRLKLGIFGHNLAPTQTLVAEAWHPTWDEVLAASVAADRAGFEAIVPLGRWKGYVEGKIDHRTNDIFDAFTFAAALGQATNHATIFSTVHAPLVHPVLMAKMGASMDHISHGRWALNVVGGWNRPEFEMFGVDLLSHGARYEYLEEWLNLLKSIWTADKEIDYNSANFRIKGAVVRPKPLQQPMPPIMNAGFSPAGQQFTARNSDIGFVMIKSNDRDSWRKQVDHVKDLGRQAGRNLRVWTSVHIVQAPSRDEAMAYIDGPLMQHADTECIDAHVKTVMAETSGLDEKAIAMYRRQLTVGAGWVLPGSPNFIADELEAIADAGFDGALLGWVNFTDGIEQFRKDVLPILEKRGLRRAFLG